jgi:DNA-binding NarL/FixJ family response regulator
MKRTIAIADDHSGIPSGLELALEKYEPEIEVKIIAANGDELLSRLEESPVDLVVLDLNMPGTDGFQLCKTIKVRWPKIIILVYSMDNSVESLQKVLKYGAHSYIGKGDSSGVKGVVDAIAKAFEGEPVFLGLQNELPPRVALGAKERSLLGVWERGITEIGQVVQALSRMEGTPITKEAVKKRRQRVVQKLGANPRTSAAGLLAMARAHGVNMFSEKAD